MNTKMKGSKKTSNRIDQSNSTSTSGYSSQTLSECDYLPSEMKRFGTQDTLASISLSPSCSTLTSNKHQFLNINTLANEPKLIRTSTPSNLVSSLQIGSSLSTISSIKKSNVSYESENKKSFIISLINFFAFIFSCFNIFKKPEKKCDSYNFDQNYPKILLRTTPIVRQQQGSSSFVYPKSEPVHLIKTKIKHNSFISSTPNNQPKYNSFIYIDEKEIYDNLPSYSIESSQTSFNKAKYTVNTEVSNSSILNENKIKSTPLLSSSPLPCNYNNFASSKSISSSILSSNSSGIMSQTPISSFKKYSSSDDPIYSNNFKKSKPIQCVSTINLSRPIAPIYEDYLCDKEVESYFENPDYFDCYKKEILINNNNNNKIITDCTNYYYYYPHNHCDKSENFSYLNSHGGLKSKSISKSSGIMSAATSASISTLSTLSSIKSNNSIMNYGGLIRQYKGESYC